MPLHENESIVLVGLPGSGKSRVGEHVAERLGRAFADTDRMVERQAGMTIHELVATEGWPHFRELERQVLAEQLQRECSVIATGGGIVESAENREAMGDAGLVFWLVAPLSILLARLARDATERPLLGKSPARRLADLADLAERREPLYAGIADHRIDTSGREETVVADMITAIVRGAQEQTR